MNIIVLVKQTPDSTTKVKIAADDKTLDAAEVKYIVNPFDEYAIEEALQIKERLGGEVTVLGLGPERASTALRTALAMGVDKAMHIVADDTHLDSHTVASALAQVLKETQFDLILMGKQAIDDYNEQIGPRLSALLDIPCLTYLAKIELGDGKLEAHREVEGGVEVIECTFPAILTVEKGINEPRYAPLKGIMLAKKKPIDQKSVELEPPKIVIKKMEYPPERPPGRIVGEGVEAVSELVRLLREEAKVI
ncbi:MAG: electron transfer flavoprotein subunit beta/FixA family protein [bacterium]